MTPAATKMRAPPSAATPRPHDARPEHQGDDDRHRGDAGIGQQVGQRERARHGSGGDGIHAADRILLGRDRQQGRRLCNSAGVDARPIGGSSRVVMEERIDRGGRSPSLMPGTCARSASEARSIALSVPKWRSSARLRVGPMPGISCSPASRISFLRRCAMRADGEAVRLVAQALDEIEQRIARLEHEGARPGTKNVSRPASRSGPLATASSGMSAMPSSPSVAVAAAQLALAAVDAPPDPARATRRRDRPAPRGASSSSRLKRRPQHLAHHAVIVARREVGRADVELAILVFLEALRAGDDHGADRIGALDVAVVVDLDALRNARQPERVGQRLEQLLLRRRVGELAAERLARIGERMRDEIALLAALRHRRPRPCDRSCCSAPRPAARALRTHARRRCSAGTACRHRTGRGTRPAPRRAQASGRPWENRRGCPNSVRCGRRTPRCK